MITIETELYEYNDYIYHVDKRNITIEQIKPKK